MKRNAKMRRNAIREWPEDDRPREKILNNGPTSLSDAELLAIILRFGGSGYSAVDLGREVLSYFGGFRHMADADITEFHKIKGLGLAKIASLIATVEIARRFWAESISPTTAIKTAEQVATLLGPHLRDLKHEVFDVLLLNGKRHSLGTIRLDEGTTTETNIYVREIMAIALQRRAASIVLVHNHPSGDPAPSKSDIQLTRRALFAGKVMDIKVQDHVIIGSSTYYSFADQGTIEKFEYYWDELDRKEKLNDH